MMTESSHPVWARGRAEVRRGSLPGRILRPATWRHIKTAIACVILPGMILPGLPANAQHSSPSFDCRRARSEAEHAICGAPDLAQLDLQIAVRFRALLKQMDGESGVGLRMDEQWFLEVRNKSFRKAAGSNEDPVGQLRDMLVARKQFLDSIDPSPPANSEGHWQNLSGEVTIRRDGPNNLTFEGTISNPVDGHQVCHATGQVTRRSETTSAVIPGNAPRAVVTLVRRRSSLSISEHTDTGGWPSYCEPDTSISFSDDYFFVNR